MSRTKKLAKDALSWLLCICLVIGWGGVSNLFLDSQKAFAADIGANPTPKVDIAVSLPADYPGTFLDFKAELTEKLIAQGMSPSDFRITDTATKIDATDQSNWVVYDHYYNQEEYNKLGYTAEQKKTHPFRAADNTCTTGGVIPMSNIFAGGGTTNKCRNFITHTYSYDDNGKANMVFAGYGTKPLVDYMYYPSKNNVRRTVSFDLDATVIDKHTLQGAGFLLNCGIDNGYLRGYVFYIIPRGSNTSIQQTADAYIYKLNNWGVNSTSVTGTQVAKTTIDLGAAKKLRISLDIQAAKVTVQSQIYDAAGNLVGTRPTDNFLNIPLDNLGEQYGGFGPIVGYTSHGCSSLTVFKYLDLEMTFDTSAFDALKTVQYYQGANQKYFINLAGNNGDPGIPDEGQTNFDDGINRMDQNEIFYLSNADDGKVLRDTILNDDGTVDQLGLGDSNGFIAMGSNYMDLMAQYIYQNHIDGAVFQHEPVVSPLPLANFYVKVEEFADGRPGTKDDQLMTVHLKHLQGNQTVKANIWDKSRPGVAAGTDGKIAQWRFKVYGPESTENAIYSSGWVDSLEKIEDFAFNKDMTPGKYIFELTVRDDKFQGTTDEAASEAQNKNHQSTTFQTYVIAFKDEHYPIITGANTNENIATFTLTDTGQGIDDDGITFLSDGRGSGVASYFITTDASATLDVDDPRWIDLPSPQHSINVDYQMTGKDKIYVWVKDECGNIGFINEGDPDHPKGGPAVFQPTLVRVEDPDGKPIKEYYVIGDKPIIVLPPDEEVPDSDDPENEQFSGWKTPGGEDVTPGTTPSPDEENTIIIRPAYSRDYAGLVYLANGGAIASSSGSQFQVVSGSSIMKKIGDHNVSASRKGYSFAGWKLLKNGLEPTEANIGNAANLEVVSTQLAKKKSDDPEANNYYLVAQWEEGKYLVRLDANGGSLGGVSKFADVKYGTSLDAAKITDAAGVAGLSGVTGRFAPTRPGHFFMGWTTSPVAAVKSADELNGKVFFKSSDSHASGITQLATAPVMGDSDTTLYAAWMVDPSKTIVSFDSAGGSQLQDQAYDSAATNYNKFLIPSRPGYTFNGWYLQKTDGSLDATANPGGGELGAMKGVNHTFVAKWTVNANTKYTVDYYVNSGNRDANGKFIYTKVTHDSYKKEYQGATESTVSIPEKDKIPELSLHDVDYWFNPKADNVMSGTVTGSPLLSLKLYYDRYLDITGVKALDSSGDGTVTSALHQKEGSKPTITWKAAEGSYVKRVVVNGEIRDDLLRTGSYTPEEGLYANTTVRVKFAKGDDPKGTPGEDTPTGPRVEPKAYSVNTTIRGCTNSFNGCSITPTQVYKAGSDVTVTFNAPCKNCKVLRVEVDGRKTNVTGNSVSFKQLSANHNVDVYVGPIKSPTLGGKDTEGVYSITVNRYGGDGTYYTSGSRTIRMEDVDDAASDWTFAWNRTVNGKESVHRIYSIKVDGVPSAYADTRVPDFGSLNLVKGKNHVVDVYFYDLEEDPTHPDWPELVEPDFSRPDQWVKVTTEIVGGAGEIDPSFSAKKEKDGQEHVVNYTLKNSQDYTADDYMYYDLQKVEVNGKALAAGDFGLDDDGNGNVKVTLKPVNDDAHVRVTVKPVAVNVDTMTLTLKKQDVLDDDGNTVTDDEGNAVKETVLGSPTEGGTIDSSKTVGKYGSYTTIKATPKANYRLIAFEKVDIADPTNNEAWIIGDDGGWQHSSVKDIPMPAAVAFSDRSDEELATDDAAAEDEAQDTAATDESEKTPAVNDDASEAEPAAVDPDSGEAAEGTQPDAEDEPEASETPADSETDDATEEAGESEAVERQPAPEVTPEEVEAVAAPIALLAMAPQDSVPLYDEAVSAPVASNGQSFIERAYAAEGENGPGKAENVFKAPQGNQSGASVGYANLTKNQRVVAYFAADDVNKEDTEGVIKTRDEMSFPVTVTFEGAGDLGGTYTGTGMVAKDGTTTVTFGDWPAGYKYDNVSIEGTNAEGNPSATAGAVTNAADGKKQITLSNITGPVEVKVQLAKKTKDEDPDRYPETPVEKTGYDPRYRVTATVEGYGGLVISRNPSSATVVAGSKNAQNYEISWEPKDLKETVPGSNTNIPYITSFKVNGVEDPSKVGPVDGKNSYVIPNVDKDYQIEIKTILMNEDVDGDGKPDYNIDDDDDGVPDRNKDTDGDGLPDTDVDTDGDGKPDVNVDTDGDGKPDVNIYDENLDGTPDNVDPKSPNPPKPNVNVDTDGDGKPDLNVDTDGDGKPDVDIVDEDGDGKPDQIDPKNPPKPNVNIDTNGDSKPDLNITVDDDYIPDVNIDTNKDGYPDVNVDTDGNYVPEINIDTDNTGTWKPSAEGGNKDKIWKPDTNIDGGDGKGPIHSDNSAPIDNDGDGVDDRWKPAKIMTADNGFKYGTTAEKWYNDVKPGTPEAKIPGKDTKDKLGKTLPQTGDEGDLPIAVTGMLAYTALVAAIFARRKMNQESRFVR